MNNDWILAVLVDLKSFARSNGLPCLAEQLDDLVIAAMAEIAATKGASDGQCSEPLPTAVGSDLRMG